MHTCTFITDYLIKYRQWLDEIGLGCESRKAVERYKKIDKKRFDIQGIYGQLSVHKRGCS